MELGQVLSQRRSIRHYSPAPVSDEQIAALLHAGTLAPSSKNRQQWGFVVLKGETKDSIADMTLQAAAHSEYASSSVQETCRVIKEAPVLILVLQRLSSGYLRGDMMSIGACIENICLKAVDMGLGSLWICDIDVAEEEIGTVLGTDKPVAAAIAVGYADESPSPRPRLEVDKITEWK